MKAKKLLAVVLTLCLLLCAMLPMAAVAAPVQISQYLTPVLHDDGYYECTYDMTTGGTAMILGLPAGQTLFVYATGLAGASVSTYATDVNGDPAAYGLIPAQGGYVAADNGEASCTAVQDMVRVYNGSETAINIMMNVTAGAPSGPDGSYDNPYDYAPNFMGIADVAFGDEGATMLNVAEGETEMVYYAWTAPADGYAYIDMITAQNMSGEIGWMYYIDNKTSGDCSAFQFSDYTDDDDDTVSFTKGDVVLFGVCTFDPNDMWATPEGVLSFRVGYSLYGAADEPYPLDEGFNEYVLDGDATHYSYTATTDTMIIVSGAAEVYEYVSGDYDALQADADGNVVVVLAEGDSIVLNPCEYTAATVDISILVAEKGSEDWPLELTEGDHAAPNTWWPGTYYTWTGEDAGLLIVDFGTYTDWMLMVNDVTYSADEGDTVAVFEVPAGETAVNIMDWGWSWNGEFSVEFEPFTTEDAPIELEEGDNYVAIPSAKPGEDDELVAGKAYATIDLDKDVILTIENYWSGITVDGDAVTPNRLGVLTVLLAAGEHEIVLDNTLEEFVELTVSVVEPAMGSFENPIEVIAAGKLSNASVEAGGEVNYAINAKLAGAVLTVKGNVVVMVDGSEVKAENGVVTVEIKPTGATMMLTIVNAGSSAATYEASIAYPDNPKTGDMGIILPALAMVMSACGAAFVCKKKD